MINLLAACPPVYTLPGTWNDPQKIANANSQRPMEESDDTEEA